MLVSDIRPPPVTYLRRVLTGNRLEDGKTFRVAGKLDVHSHTFTMTVDVKRGSEIGTRVETDRMPDTMLGTGVQLPDDLLRTGDAYPPPAAAATAAAPSSAPRLPMTATERPGLRPSAILRAALLSLGEAGPSGEAGPCGEARPSSAVAAGGVAAAARLRPPAAAAALQLRLPRQRLPASSEPLGLPSAAGAPEAETVVMERPLLSRATTGRKRPAFAVAATSPLPAPALRPTSAVTAAALPPAAPTLRSSSVAAAASPPPALALRPISYYAAAASPPPAPALRPTSSAAVASHPMVPELMRLPSPAKKGGPSGAPPTLNPPSAAVTASPAGNSRQSPLKLRLPSAVPFGAQELRTVARAAPAPVLAAAAAPGDSIAHQRVVGGRAAGARGGCSGRVGAIEAAAGPATGSGGGALQAACHLAASRKRKASAPHRAAQT